MMPLQIGRGHVHHSRREICENSFRYPTFFMFFNCARESELKQMLGTKFKKTISFSSRDYLNGQEAPLDLAIKDFLKESCAYQADDVWLHTMPRMLGYAFNPVSFWMCYKNGNLDAVLVEVNNTFGERHFYWVRDTQPLATDRWYKLDKVFHVSPFFPVEGFYQFRFKNELENLRIDINYHDPSGPLRLATWVTGKLSPLNEQSASAIFIRYGWMTVMVVLRIHYQAVRLWFKKARFYRQPALPKEKVTQ